MDQTYSYRKKDGVTALQEGADRGRLQVTVLTEDGAKPVENAVVRISYTGVPDSVLEELKTDSSGQTPVLELAAPPLEYSMEPSEEQPYAEYTVQIRAEGYEPEEIAGTEILPDVLAQQPVRLRSSSAGEFERIVIGPHTLFGDYPPKEPEAEVKPVDETGEIVLSRVVIPEYVVVHDGPVNDAQAKKLLPEI